MTLLPNRDTPGVCFVASDVDQAWREIGKHLLHDARTYAECNPNNETSAGIADVSDVDELRATSRTHRIFTADEAVAHVRGGGRHRWSCGPQNASGSRCTSAGTG
jgi:hypothetical protein